MLRDMSEDYSEEFHRRVARCDRSMSQFGIEIDAVAGGELHCASAHLEPQRSLEHEVEFLSGMARLGRQRRPGGKRMHGDNERIGLASGKTGGKDW